MNTLSMDLPLDTLSQNSFFIFQTDLLLGTILFFNTALLLILGTLRIDLLKFSTISIKSPLGTFAKMKLIMDVFGLFGLFKLLSQELRWIKTANLYLLNFLIFIIFF